MFYLRFADCSALVFDCFQSVLLYDFVKNFVTAHTVNHWRKQSVMTKLTLIDLFTFAAVDICFLIVYDKTVVR